MTRTIVLRGLAVLWAVGMLGWAIARAQGWTEGKPDAPAEAAATDAPDPATPSDTEASPVAPPLPATKAGPVAPPSEAFFPATKAGEVRKSPPPQGAQRYLEGLGLGGQEPPPQEPPAEEPAPE